MPFDNNKLINQLQTLHFDRSSFQKLKVKSYIYLLLLIMMYANVYVTKTDQFGTNPDSIGRSFLTTIGSSLGYNYKEVNRSR